MLLLLPLLTLVRVSHAASVCRPDFCEYAQCDRASVSNCQGEIVPYADQCGCCHVCIKQLDLKESCQPSRDIKSPRCGYGLFCDMETNTCQYDCNKKRQEILDRLAKAPYLVGLALPRCDKDGSYDPIQCEGARCHCTGKRGNALHYGVNRADTQGMNCKCEREKSDYRKSGLIGKMFRCKENGNYEDVQCLGSVCFCVDENGKQRQGSESIDMTDIESLNC